MHSGQIFLRSQLVAKFDYGNRGNYSGLDMALIKPIHSSAILQICLLCTTRNKHLIYLPTQSKNSSSLAPESES